MLFDCASADTSAPTLTTDSPTEATLTSANSSPTAASAQSSFSIDSPSTSCKTAAPTAPGRGCTRATATMRKGRPRQRPRPRLEQPLPRCHRWRSRQRRAPADLEQQQQQRPQHDPCAQRQHHPLAGQQQLHQCSLLLNQKRLHVRYFIRAVCRALSTYIIGWDRICSTSSSLEQDTKCHHYHGYLRSIRVYRAGHPADQFTIYARRSLACSVKLVNPLRSTLSHLDA